MAGPPFGTASAYSDSFPAPPPRELTVSAETCFNLTVFRDVVRQYRKLDDQVVTRLNRAQAQLRDEARVGKGSSPEGMCAKMWLEMISGWTHRQTLLTYCINTVEGSMNAKRAAAGGPTDERLAAAPGGAHERGVREEQAVSDSLHSESAVEAIVRKRTLEVFKSRCPFFTPPPGRDRGWWDIAESGRMTSSGPE
ncbi:Coiled-coil domain-containing protein 58 [Vanrija pseudolonga]|uniref:Coiled-coil domain-containing protein 58 n=1 Tax=Vanrija pseudolonga TaxID=143232 RepID=A0AAF1BJI3_9TREE|nr:Coiled-coil domain-containing protein 58 [Vanrija pseudolonga]